MNQFLEWDDTIVALATAQGVSAIGVIRVSGKKALSIINELFPSKDLSIQTTHTIHVGYLKDEKEILDEVVLSLFIAPHSYTGEDVVEISCHGSPFIQQKIIRAIIAKGARLAKAGEFTQRAFLNGKMDLVQAESVADLILSNTEASRNAALKNMRKGFSKQLDGLRDELIQFAALIELELDFAEEDVEFADRTAFYKLIHQLQTDVNQLLKSFALGNVIKNGVQVAIIGKPNAGKSTLLNTLLNENRAIVSEIAGTTRDTIEEVLNIEGILFRLVDTAGIREHSLDTIENMGIERSLEKMKQSDIVIYLFDVNEISNEELLGIEDKFHQQNIQYLLVGNKAENISDVHEKFDSEVVFISAKERWNIDALKTTLFQKTIGGSIHTESSIVTNERHYASLLQLNKGLNEVEKGLNDNISGDLLALDIRTCLHYLGEITGTITNEDKLDYIFSKFCIGK